MLGRTAFFRSQTLIVGPGSNSPLPALAEHQQDLRPDYGNHDGHPVGNAIVFLSTSGVIVE
jgi:hypothetical protein